MQKLILIFSFPFLFFNLSGQVNKAQDLITFFETKVYSPNLMFNVQMDIFKDNEIKNSYVMNGFRKEGKFRIEFEEPVIEKGRRLLNDGKSLWLFLPRSSKTIRLSNKQSFMGSDASNSDILKISLQDEYIVDSLTVADEANIVHLSAKDPGTAYHHVKVFFDKQSNLPLKQEFLSMSGRTIRIIEFSDFKMIEGYLYPMKATIRSMLKQNTKTELVYNSVSRSCTKPDFFFTTSSLRK